mmetsp:Transcript_10006/g.15163  ORF Transcript_10006/g.15163 Transcript_10006/m.15163 type:complete len:148 (+) Transcript_10006:944-1387(+)
MLKKYQDTDSASKRSRTPISKYDVCKVKNTVPVDPFDSLSPFPEGQRHSFVNPSRRLEAKFILNPTVATKNQDRVIKIDDSKNFRFNEETGSRRQRPTSNYKKVEAKFLRSKQDLDKFSVYSKDKSSVQLPSKQQRSHIFMSTKSRQ